MKLYRNVSIMTLAAYTLLMFVDPLIVAWTAIAMLIVNITTMYSVEYYAKKMQRDEQKKHQAALLSALTKINRIEPK